MHSSKRLLQIAAAILLLVGLALPVRADIFQWEYINPADPSQGKRQSTTLAPDGAGVDAVPGAFLSLDLTMAYMIGADLTGAYGAYAILTNADLSQANLTNAHFGDATLTDADFTDAEVRGASFEADYDDANRGISLAQLYSTASYQAHDLTGIGLQVNDLTGGNFADQNLTNAYLYGATLADANFTNAQVQGAFLFSVTERGFTAAQLYSTASYQAHDLTSISLALNDLGGWDFAGQNLTDASFYGATLTDADFTDAQVRGAYFGPDSSIYIGGISLSQLYSTASYKAHDLSGINLTGINLAGGNFAGQNLTYASFQSSTLTDPDFRQANLTNADFAGAGLNFANFRQANLANANFARCGSRGCFYAILANADLTAADARGALLDATGATTTNLIGTDGHINGLGLNAGALLVVRDYDGDPTRTDRRDGRPTPVPPIPITVDQHLSMAASGTLRMVFEADAWDSTISFAPGIPVTLGGTLELTFAADVNPATQLGRTFDLFNWTGVTPTGAFAISTPYAWDLSNLYTTGQVTLTAIPEPAALLLALAALIMTPRRAAR
jgi:uncharacterized protein YjbI with pentapeptide repeats